MDAVNHFAHYVLVVYVLPGAPRLPGLRIITLFCLKRVMITLPLFSSPHACFGRCSYFLRFRRWLFRFSPSFFAAFGFVFFSPRKALSGQSLPFYRPDDACRLFYLHRLFRFLARRFTDVARCAFAGDRLKSILRSSILTASTRTSTRRPGDKSGRWIHPSGVALPGQAIVVIVQRRDMDQTINEQVARRTKKPKPVTLEITPLKTLLPGRA